MAESATIGGAVALSTTGLEPLPVNLYVPATTNTDCIRERCFQQTVVSSLRVHAFLRRSIVTTSRSYADSSIGGAAGGGGVHIRPRGRNDGASEKLHGPKVN